MSCGTSRTWVHVSLIAAAKNAPVGAEIERARGGGVERYRGDEGRPETRIKPRPALPSRCRAQETSLVGADIQRTGMSGLDRERSHEVPEQAVRQRFPVLSLVAADKEPVRGCGVHAERVQWVYRNRSHESPS